MEDGWDNERTLQRTRSRCSVTARDCCGFYVLHGAYQTVVCYIIDVRYVFWKTFSIFKKNPARRAAYLKCNDICVSHEDSGTSYLFTLMY